MINITRAEKKIKVTTPYNDDFIYYAKNNGGRWDSSNMTWDFPLNAEDGIKSVLLDIFGWKEGEELKRILVKVRAHEFEEYNQIQVGSTILAYRLSKTGRVIFNDDAAVVEGSGFPSKGGSAKYPKCEPYKDTVIKATISQHDYDTLSDEQKQFVDIVEVLTEKEEKITKLQAEKARLTARLAEIEKELEELEA